MIYIAFSLVSIALLCVLKKYNSLRNEKERNYYATSSVGPLHDAANLIECCYVLPTKPVPGKLLYVLNNKEVYVCIDRTLYKVTEIELG